MEKKYEFTDETIMYCGEFLHRIRAIKNFGDVRRGNLGGFIQKEENLSHEGDCWIYNDAKVYNNAKIYDNAGINDNVVIHGNAKVFGNVSVYGNALIQDNAKVYGNAKIFDDAIIRRNAKVFGDSLIRDNVFVSDNSKVFGNCTIRGNAKVYGDAIIHDNVFVCGNSKIYNAIVSGKTIVSSEAKITKDISSTDEYIVIGPIGSRNDFTTFIKTNDDDIYVHCGCFAGTLDEFNFKVLETHGDNKHSRDYMDAINFVMKKFNRVEKEIIKIPLLNNIGKPNINGVIISEEAFEKYINSDLYKEMINDGRLYLTYGGTAGEFYDIKSCSVRLDIISDYIIGKVKNITKKYISVEVTSNKDILDRSLELGYKAYLIYQALEMDDKTVKNMRIMYCSIGPDIMKGVTNDD